MSNRGAQKARAERNLTCPRAQILQRRGNTAAGKGNARGLRPIFAPALPHLRLPSSPRSCAFHRFPARPAPIGGSTRRAGASSCSQAGEWNAAADSMRSRFRTRRHAECENTARKAPLLSPSARLRLATFGIAPVRAGPRFAFAPDAPLHAHAQTRVACRPRSNFSQPARAHANAQRVRRILPALTAAPAHAARTQSASQRNGARRQGSKPPVPASPGRARKSVPSGALLPARTALRKQTPRPKARRANVSGVCKPSSVLDGHLSRPAVASGLKRLPGSATGRRMCSPINLAPGGVYRADKSPSRW